MAKHSASYVLSGWGFSADVIVQAMPSSTDFISLSYEQLALLPFDTIIDALAQSLPDNSSVLAWSLGGLLAIAMAARYPQKISQLILINSQPCFSEKDGWLGTAVIQQHRFCDLLGTPKQLKQSFIATVAHPQQDRPLRQCLGQYYLADKISDYAPMLEWMWAVDLREQYRKLTCGLNHIVAENDAVIPSSKRQLLALNPRANILSMAGAGHACFLTHPNMCSDFYQGCLYESS